MSLSPAAPARLVTVGLMWHSLGSGNLGVGALTESNIAIVRGVADRLGIKVRFLILGTSDTTEPGLAQELRQAGHDLQVRRIRIFRSEFAEAVRSCDLVLDIGEGDSFADIYGLKRFLFYWRSKSKVVGLGRPLVLSPQTLGPFDGSIARLLARRVMKRCRRVFSRDQLSTQYLHQLGLRGNVSETIDVAFRLPYQAQPPRTGGKVKFGINVSGLLWNGGYTGNNQFGLRIDYAATMRALMKILAQRPEVEVHLISHVIEPHIPVEDDVLAAHKLAAEFPDAVVAPAFTRPSEVKTYIAGMDFVTGARMHACIAALSAGVAVVPLAYSRKFNGLLQTVGYDWLADGRAMNETEVVDVIMRGFEQRETLAAQARAARDVALQRLEVYEQGLQDLLQEARDGSRPRR